MGDSYTNVGTVRWIVRVEKRGRTVVLDDGSTWRVVPSDREISRDWYQSLTVKVSRIQDELYGLEPEEGLVAQACFDDFRKYQDAAPGSEPD